MIDGVPNDVHQRIRQLFDDEFVDFGIGTGDNQSHFLFVLPGNLSNHSRQLVEHLPERDHSNVKNPVL